MKAERMRGGGDQEVNANGSAGTLTGPVRPCACVFSVIRRTRSGSKPLKPAADLLPPTKKKMPG